MVYGIQCALDFMNLQAQLTPPDKLVNSMSIGLTKGFIPADTTGSRTHLNLGCLPELLVVVEHPRLHEPPRRRVGRSHGLRQAL